MSTDFDQRRNAFNAHLNACGMTPQLMQDQITKSAEVAGAFASDLFKRAIAQATYDQFMNLPTKTLSPSTYDPNQAFRSGLIGAIGQYLEWDPTAALELCRDIMEDVNMSEYAAGIQTWIDEPETQT